MTVQLAGEIFGSSLPVRALIKFLWHRTSHEGEPADSIKLLLQGRILEISERKSFAAKQGMADWEQDAISKLW